MFLTGIADEAGAAIDTQIKATRELGWKQLEARAVEVPGFPKANFHDIPDAAFEVVVQRLAEAGVGVYCFGSTIMNWAKRITDPFEVTLGEVQRAIPRMQRLRTRFVRIMSFRPDDYEDTVPAVVFERVREVTRRFLDAGIQPVHENDLNYGSMNWRNALELLEKCPGLKWAFDTANPVTNFDRAKPKPWPRQDAWEFWTHVRDQVAHIHVKDAIWDAAKNKPDYQWPGEGHGHVREILRDALARGYDGGISIEPHMATVFHDASVKSSEEMQFANYVEYGRRMEKLVGSIKPD